MWRRRLAGAAGSAVVALGAGGTAVQATVGVGIQRPPRYHIARRVIDPYLGRYRTGPQSPGSRLVTSVMLVTIDGSG